MTNKEKIMIYIESETKKKLENLSKKDKRSMSNYIVKLIENKIEESENAMAAMHKIGTANE